MSAFIKNDEQERLFHHHHLLDLLVLRDLVQSFRHSYLNSYNVKSKKPFNLHKLYPSWSGVMLLCYLKSIF